MSAVSIVSFNAFVWALLSFAAHKTSIPRFEKMTSWSAKAVDTVIHPLQINPVFLRKRIRLKAHRWISENAIAQTARLHRTTCFR